MDDSDDNYECPYCRSNFAHPKEKLWPYITLSGFKE